MPSSTIHSPVKDHAQKGKSPFRVTRRQHKHELLVNFISAAKTKKRPAPMKPDFIRKLFSFFL
jgi:hypothetical protein